MTSMAYLDQFSEKLRCSFSSPATVKNYTSAVSSFFSFCLTRQETDPAALLRAFILEHLKNAQAKTINLYRAAIVKFFRLVKDIEIDAIAVPRRKEPHKLPQVLSGDTIREAILKTNNIKHRLIISLFYGCGLRLSEVQYLVKRNIIPAKNLLWLEDTKGQKHRIVPIPETIRPALYEFIAGLEDNQRIFGDLSKRTFEKIVSNAFERIGVWASPHMLRHSYATNQVMSGQPLPKVQHWLGHSSVKTTQIYVHLSEAILSKSTDLLAKEEKVNEKGV